MLWIIGLFTVVLVLDSLFLILLVLVQLPKKEAGIGQAFGGGATDALFGAGSGNALTKMTKYARGILRHFGERIAAARTEEGVGGAAAECLADARLFLGQLHQHQQDQKQRVEHEHDGKKANNPKHMSFVLNGVSNNIRETPGLQ